MGLQLATALSKMMKPSETCEMVLFGFLCLLIVYAARVIYLAPKTMPPKWKKYEEEKRQRKMYEEYERQQREGLVRRRGSTQLPGSLHLHACYQCVGLHILHIAWNSSMATQAAQCRHAHATVSRICRLLRRILALADAIVTSRNYP